MRHIKLVMEDEDFKEMEDLKISFEKKEGEKVSWEYFIYNSLFVNQWNT